MRTQPDDPGPCGESFPAPLIFGAKAKRHADSVERTIRKNAGKVSKQRIAATICWSVETLERFAHSHGIDLTYPVQQEPEPVGA